MKKIFSFLLFLSLSNSILAQFKTIEDVSKQVVLAFQQQSFDTLKKTLVTANDYDTEVAPKIERDTTHKIPRILQEKAHQFYTTNGYSMNEHVFNFFQKEGTQCGITDWKEIQYENLTSDIYDTLNATTFIHRNLLFSYKGKEYYMYGLTFH